MLSERTFKKTRLAPTPSGYLHLGNLYSFALTAALAAKTGARILLRIDDMDKDRIRDDYIEDIFDTLNFMNIPWDEGPRNTQEFKEHYSQNQRRDLYEKELKILVEKGLVYACSCSRKEVESLGGSYPGTCRHKKLALDAKEVCWRLNTAASTKLKLKEYGGKVSECELPEVMKDFVIRRKDGLPAYQLCSLVDDIFFGIDLIVRGEDLLPSTLAQLYLADALDKNEFANCTFYHHSLIRGDDGLKLSKSIGSSSIRNLREIQYSAQDMYSLLGRQIGLEKKLHSWKEISLK